jgi:hypothetical protein
MSKEREAAAPVVNLDFSDPKVLMGVLAQMFQQQAESTAINKRMLEIEEAKQVAQQKKDADALAKLERARKLSLDELKNKDKNDKARWARCSHKDQNLGWTIWPISNMPNGRLIGHCNLCFLAILPEHVEEDAYGKKTVVPEHPLYHIVLEREQHLYASFLPVMNY